MQFKMPQDQWGPIVPRTWQSEALPKLIGAYSQPNPLSYVVRAVTGSGKSKLMAQMAACCHLESNECVVVSTSSIFLVEQLEDTFRERLESGGFMGGPNPVGCYYMHGKNTTAPVIITCTPSLPELAKRLEANGRKCALWIADEVQRSAAPSIINGHALLKPATSCGYSATPFRSKWSESLTLFDQVLVNYTAQQAIKDGVVVEFVPVFWNGGEGSLDDICCQLIALARGPGMVNSVSIDDSEVFCMKAIDSGLLAKTLHSKMPRAERKKRLEELRTGQLNCLVHVSILQEGCDLPWLRWLCMRRPVGSRVRFLQELGRILRAYTDPVTGDKKTEAIVYDPHCLFQDFQMTYEAVLGGEIDEPEDEDDGIKEVKPSEKKKKDFEQLIFEVMREIINVKAGKKPLSLTPLSAYLVELVTAFDLCQLVDRKIANHEWRRQPASGKQAQAAQNLIWTAGIRAVPKIHRKPLEMLTSHVPQMTKGMSADLLSVMMSLADYKKWPDLKVLDRSAESSVRAHEQRAQDMVSKPFTTPQIVLPHKSTSKKPEQPKLF